MDGRPAFGPGYSGIWPHLDSLYAASNIDLVAFDNYMPLADWTTGDGGLDAQNWRAPTPSSWPVAAPNTRGYAFSTPDLDTLAYVQANIEGGEKFDYFYTGYSIAQALDPNGRCNGSPRRRATDWPRRAAPIPPASGSSPSSRSAGGGTIHTQRRL